MWLTWRSKTRCRSEKKSRRGLPTGRRHLRVTTQPMASTRITRRSTACPDQAVQSSSEEQRRELAQRVAHQAVMTLLVTIKARQRRQPHVKSQRYTSRRTLEELKTTSRSTSRSLIKRCSRARLHREGTRHSSNLQSA